MEKFYSRVILIILTISFMPFYFLSGQVSIQGDNNTEGSSIQSASGYSKFTWLGDNVNPYAVSPDGRVVVGGYNNKAFRWNEKTGLVILQDLNPTLLPSPSSIALGVSNDGMVIVGYSAYDTIKVGNSVHYLYNAVRWSSSGGITALPSMGYKMSRAWAVDAAGINIVGDVDSTFIGGSPSSPYFNYHSRASRWTGSSVSYLPGVHAISRVYGISPDGSVAVGSAQPSAVTGAQTAAKWDSTGMKYLGFTYPPYSKAVCASTNGNVVIVQKNTPYPSWSYRLTVGGVTAVLGDSTDPKAITADGRRIVGLSSKKPEQRAIIWDAGSSVFQDLKLFLQNSHGIILNNIRLWGATGISANGNVIVGWGIDSGGFYNKGYRVVLNPGPIMVWKPIKGSFWLAGTVDTIRWTCYKNIDSVNIFFSTDSGVTQHLIASGVPGDSGSFPWMMPNDVMSAKCLIKIVASSGSDSGRSEMFKVKGTYLTRYNSSGQYENFSQPRHQYSFGNEAKWIWPQSWWLQFNYVTSIDPVTGTFYPFDSMYPFRAAADSNFSDWPNFVRAFGVAQCYWSPTSTGYKEKALTKWASIKGEWGGSCFGFSTSSLMAFEDKTRFLTTFPQMPGFSALEGVVCTDSVRSVINQLQIYTSGATHYAYVLPRWSTITPTQTLQELRNDFLNDTRDVKVLNIYKQTGDPAAHAIVPYKLEQDTINPQNYWISVYDNSYHTDYNARIIVDTVADTWDYSNWTGWGGAKGLMLMDPVSSYYSNDTLTRALSFNGPPVITAGKQSLASSKYCELYSSSRSSILIKDMQGNRIGYQNQEFFNEISGAGPLIPLDSREAPPIGYLLPLGRYSVTLGEASDSTISFSLISDSSVMTFQHHGVAPLQEDQLEISDMTTMRMINNDLQTKKVDMKLVVEEPNAEKVFRVNNFDVMQGDSITVAAFMLDQLKLSHTGISTINFDIRIEHNSQNGLVIFSKTGIQIDGSAGYVFVPNWNNFANDTTMQILIDRGNDGTVDDTLWIQNELLGVNDQGSLIPGEYKLYQNYPNPFNPTTKIKFSIPTKSHVDIRIYDVLGRVVTTLSDGYKEAGYYDVEFNGANLSNGIYFYKINAVGVSDPSKTFVQIRKMILLK
ncbi:MAG: T9SS type A sorting domain-containing protein [Bacteroidota bacterium]|nr:T9SS type A sorting domain-containing protein [Bacteroidota bacterium]